MQGFLRMWGPATGLLQFLCRFAFLSTFRLSNRTPKITQILKITL